MYKIGVGVGGRGSVQLFFSYGGDAVMCDTVDQAVIYIYT